MTNAPRESVRLQFSGFVLFLSRLISVGTGLLFVLIATRNISTREFGVFGNLSDVLGYFTLASTIMPFWTTRFLARRHVAASKTGLTANLIMSAIFSLLYLLLLSTIMAMLRIDEAYRIVYAVLTFQIMEIHALAELEAILQATRPHLIGFGFLTFEACKITAGFFLVLWLKLGLLGVVCSIIFAYAVQVAFYLKFTLGDLGDRVRWSFVKEWIKASPINLYNIAGQRLASLVLILLFMYGGQLARAYYGAASTIAGIVGYSSFLAFALYPRLLSRDNPEDVLTSLRRVSMFMMPMTTGAIVLSDSYLVILNPVYRDARLVLILLSVSNACISLSYIFGSVVIGSEKLDAEGKIVLKELIKSRLFLDYSLPYIESSFTVPLAYFTLTNIAKGAMEAAMAIAFINATANITILSIRYTVARRCMRFSIPWPSIAKYVAASAVMALALYAFPSPTRLSATLALTFFGGAIYLAVLSAIDRETRVVFRSARQTIRNFVGM